MIWRRIRKRGQIVLGVAVAIAPLWFAGHAHLWPRTCDGCSGFAIDVARSFREQPWRWRETDHRAIRDDGLDLWTSNGASSLRPFYTELKGNPDNWKMLNGLFGSYEQRYVWVAYREWHQATSQSPEAWPASKLPFAQQ